jgi:hypothetical protein
MSAIPGFGIALLKRTMDLANRAFSGRSALSHENIVFCRTVNKEYYPNYFLIDAKDAFYIVIRGSACDEDWVTDLDFNETTKQFGEYTINCHSGFYKATKNIFEEMKPTLLKYTDRKVIITGHSLGGAITTSLAVMMLTHPETRDMDVYAIAFAPAPTLAYIPDFIAKRMVSIVNNDDIVPTLCIPALFNLIKPAIPSFGVPRVFMKIIFKILLTAIKENGAPFSDKLYDAGMEMVDVIVDQLDDYFDDQTCLKVKYLGGTIYHVKKGSSISQSIVPPSRFDLLSISTTSFSDHDNEEYFRLVNTLLE